MNIAVRYYSRSGNTKAVADAIAKSVGVPASSVDAVDSTITETVDVLFIGGALYAYGLDSHLKDYLKTLKKDNIKKAVVFSTSEISKHAIVLIKQELADAGILVENEAFYGKGKQESDSLDAAKQFAGKFR